MPRVSDQHLASRRRQILDAARTCFLRNGFHATTMQDVIAEAGLSVGAVYRYFKSKNEIVTAIAEEVIGSADELLTGLQRQEPSLSTADIVERAVAYIDGETGPDGISRLAIQVWAESLRDPVLAGFVSSVYQRIRQRFVELAQLGQQRGELPKEADPEALGAVLFGLLPAYALQRVLTGSPDRETYTAAVVALLRR